MPDGLVLELKLSGFDAYSEKAHAALAQALEAEAQAFVSDAQSRAPVDTGYLRDHISYEVIGDLEVDLKSEASYSAFQEYGTRYQAGTSFFTPALDQVTERFPGRVKVALDELEGEKLL